jgi:hypothetical protein
MIIISLIIAYAVGRVFAPQLTHAIARAVVSVFGSVAFVLLIFLRFCPGSSRSIRRL